MQTTCPACGQPASGRFCSSCGTSLEERVTCTECGNELPPGGRFCNRCGAPTAATRAAAALAPPPPSRSLAVPIGVGVVAVLAIGFFLVNRTESPETDQPVPATAAVPTAAGTPPDISNLSPREAADRLFTRVVSSAENGDSATARQFLPMAIAAYQMVPELDADAHYHLGTLKMIAGDGPGVKSEAETILAAQPDHLFGLYLAARAEALLGNPSGSEEHFQRLLEVFDAESAKQLTEYEAHQPALASIRQEAVQATGTP